MECTKSQALFVFFFLLLLPLHPPIIGESTVPPEANPPPIDGSTLSPTPPPVISPPPASFPVDNLKVWARMDLFGGGVNIEVGDPAANQCCQMPQGRVDLEAAVCLCTVIKLNLINLNVCLVLLLPLT